MDLKNYLSYTFLFLSVVLSLCIESVVTKIAYSKALNLKENSYNRKNVSSEQNLTLESKEDGSNTTILKASDAFQSPQAISEENTTLQPLTISTSRVNNSCTCGIFLGSQFVKGSSSAPKGDAVISTTLERTFKCNAMGQKQCQTKCLEKIVQHLPNSAKILCAALDFDIKKQKAFLFVRNCNSNWHNTNLTAGREYCCKNGLPYNCPKK